MNIAEARKTGDMILFAQVVQAGTITGGSKLMGLERSTVSRRITSLEGRLGVSLLERSTRKLRLTEIGRQYYQHCIRVVEAAEDAEAAARGYKIEPSGVLNIATSICEADKFLSAIVTEFIELNDQIHVELNLEGDDDTLLSQDAELLLQCGKPTIPGMTGIQIGYLPESLWASPAYLARMPSPGNPEGLSQAATICLASNHEDVQWQLSSDNERIELTVFPRFRVHTLAGCRDACLSGLGVARLPDYLCAEAERRGQLVRAYPDWTVRGPSVFAVHSEQHYMTRKASSFTDFLKLRLRNPAPGRYPLAN